MLSTGLPVSRYVSVQISLTTPGVTSEAINTGLIVGSSPVIDVTERMRQYADINEVAQQFPATSPEYLAADAWFSQNPRPSNLMLGRWVKTAAPAQLVGGALALAEQNIALWQAITAGSFQITTAAQAFQITGLSFAGAANLNAVASTINTALAAAGASCAWNGAQFVFTTVATGAAASIGYLAPATPPIGTDISARLKGTQATADHLAQGAAPETALSAVQAIDALYSSQFYGLVVPEGSDSDQEQIAAYVEACDPPHYFGVTTQDTTSLDPAHTTDLAATLAGLGYNKTAVQYSTSSPYAVCSYLARILTTQWTGENTAITLMYKQEPGIEIEPLSSQNADALEGKSCNVYTGVANGAQIIEYGTSSSGEFTDTIIGADALALDVQAALFNSLYTTPTKVPQTDPGMSILVTAASAVCARYVGNDYLAPGVWNAPGFGTIKQGDTLPLGFYVYAPSIALQDEADRAARQAPLITIACKCAGAIHQASVLIMVNQ